MAAFRTALAAKNLTLMAVNLIRDGDGAKRMRLREPRLLELAVTNIMNETVLNELGSGCSLLLREDTYIVLMNAEVTGLKSRRETLLIAASRISEHLAEYLGAEAAIGISTTYSRLSFLGEQLREALEASEHYLFYGERGIAFPETAPEPMSVTGEIRALRDDFRVRMETGQFALAGERSEELLKKLGDEKSLAPKQARAVALELVYTAIGKARQIGGAAEELDGVYGNAPYEIQRLGYHGLRAWTMETLGGIQDWIDRHRRKYGEAAQNAIDYIRLRFAEELSLQEVADHVHLSRTYFSELFKKETGMNFNEFLIQVRLENAKALLSERSMKVSEVAEKVGYGNASYFIKVFKKQYGLSPYEYMESLHGTRHR
jgi:AraC-like DNA-binding protein